MVANNVPAKTVAELIAYSRTVPQKMNYASAGIGSVSHLTFEVFKAATGMDVVHVPYKGGGPAMNDVVAGHVALNMAAIQVAKGLVEAGKIKGLFVTSAARSPVLPNVPTLQEAGVKTADVELRFWFGIFGPKGIPEAIKAKLEKAVSTATWRTRRCASASPSSTSSRTLSPAPRCGTKLENEIKNWTQVHRRQGHQAGMNKKEARERILISSSTASRFASTPTAQRRCCRCCARSLACAAAASAAAPSNAAPAWC